MDANRATAAVLVLLAAILGVLLIRGNGPPPLPITADARDFSAARAIVSLHQILGDDTPHPVGSPAHDAVRDRLVSTLRSLGLEVSIQQRFICNAYGACQPVSNVLARMPGDARADTLVLAAHYDSVGAGPGASDDGIGVAALVEVARAIRNERFRNSILFLITDGEELGLLGAEAFVADANLSRNVATVINVDNRGTSGRSYLFETSRNNRWLLPIVARALPWPATSSLFYDIYEMLPNDTDMTVFKRVGLSGINFGSIGGVARYHTPLDNLAHVTPSTVQDHGDHILAMTRALADADLRQSANHNAVYFDVLSLFVVWWPQPWTPFFAAGALLVLLAAAAVGIRDGQTSAAAITAGVAWFLLSILAVAVLAAAAAWIASLRSVGATWVAQPGPSLAAMWLIGAATPIGLASLFRRRVGFDGLFLGAAICWSAIAIALTMAVPGASYLAMVPAIAFAIAATIRATTAGNEFLGAIIVALVTALLHFPLALTFYSALGGPALVVIAVVIALVATTFAPVVAAAPLRRSLLPAMIATAVVCVLMQILLPPYTRDWPRHLNVRYVDDGSPQWEVDALARRLLRAARFDLTPHAHYNWLLGSRRVYRAPASREPLTPPELNILLDEGSAHRHIVARLRSTRGASRLALYARTPALESLRVNGTAPASRSARFREFLAPGWQRVIVRGAQEVEIDLTLRRSDPIDVVIADSTPGLPPAGAALAAARDASIAVPADDGDTTTVMREMRLTQTPPAAWSASIWTGGGFAGAGKGMIVVRSDGSSSCGQISEEQRRQTDGIVTLANPASWKASYRLPVESGRTDQFYYSLTLEITKRDGSKVSYSASWQDDSFDMLPHDVHTLYEALWGVLDAHGGRCR